MYVAFKNNRDVQNIHKCYRSCTAFIKTDLSEVMHVDDLIL